MAMMKSLWGWWAEGSIPWLQSVTSSYLHVFLHGYSCFRISKLYFHFHWNSMNFVCKGLMSHVPIQSPETSPLLASTHPPLEGQIPSSWPSPATPFLFAILGHYRRLWFARFLWPAQGRDGLKCPLIFLDLVGHLPGWFWACGMASSMLSCASSRQWDGELVAACGRFPARCNGGLGKKMTKDAMAGRAVDCMGWAGDHPWANHHAFVSDYTW